ncbi:MAG: hypothetical protein P8P36_10620 [Akkermansiaceae bacterium]|nr:hypothetical protein [Akkermansiaceae bacterium]
MSLITFCGYLLFKSYLHSDKFRVLIGQVVSGVIGADTKFEAFEWRGMSVSTGGFRAEGSNTVKSLHADDLRARIRLLSVLRGEWFIENLQLAQLQADVVVGDQPARGDIEFGTESRMDLPPESEPKHTPEHKRKKGFLDRVLPSRARLQSFEVSRLELKVHTQGRVVELADGLLRATRRTGHKHSYDFSLSDATVETPWLVAPMKLRSVKGKYADKNLYIHDSSSQLFSNGQLSLSGQLAKDHFEWHGTLENIGVDELVAEDWKKRLSGVLSSEFKVQSKKNGFSTRGEITLSKGVLTALPVLDRIAAYTNTNRFRQLRLTECGLKYSSMHRKDSTGTHVRIELSDIVLVSEGLVRVMGDLVIDGGNLDGDFRVGIVPGLLAHIPGAETKIFERGEKGLRWAPLRITGTVEQPKEDLSERMIAAAGERIIELIPETGEKTLELLGEKASDLPKAAVDIGSELIERGDDALERGTDALREGVDNVLDLIPGFN